MNAQAKTTTATAASGRKAWKKRTPAEVVLAEEGKLKEEIAHIEVELAAKRRQLQKFAEARKIFEAT
jgi:hypothetical protein